MASFVDRAALIDNPTVNAVVKIAAAIVALDVIEEQGVTGLDQRRVFLAVEFLNNPTEQATRMVPFVVADDGIAEKATLAPSDPSLDADITARIYELWSKFAGVGHSSTTSTVTS